MRFTFPGFSEEMPTLRLTNNLGARGALLSALIHFFQEGRWGSFEARIQFKARHSAEGDEANAEFLVVGEELTRPRELLTQQRLDGLWNERFQGLVRAALLGENVGGLNFEDTVRRAIDCRIEGVFTDEAQAIN